MGLVNPLREAAISDTYSIAGGRESKSWEDGGRSSRSNTTNTKNKKSNNNNSNHNNDSNKTTTSTATTRATTAKTITYRNIAEGQAVIFLPIQHGRTAKLTELKLDWLR